MDRYIGPIGMGVPGMENNRQRSHAELTIRYKFFFINKIFLKIFFASDAAKNIFYKIFFIKKNKFL